MIRRAIFLALVFFLCTAQTTPPGFPPGAFLSRGALDAAGTGATCGGYTGPGDVISGAGMWFGLRAYSAATCGNPAINVCLAADVTCADMSSSATTGALVIGTVGGSNCSVVTCTVKIIYDQSGANGCSAAPCNMTQATEANRFTLVVNCAASLPCLSSTLHAQIYPQIATTPTGLGSQPITQYAIAQRPATLTAGANLAYCNSGMFTWETQATDTVSAYYGSGAGTVSGFTSGAFHTVTGVQNGGSSTIKIDNGSPASVGNLGSDSCNGFSMSIQGGEGSAASLWREVGVWGSALSTTQQTNLAGNNSTYWGF